MDQQSLHRHHDLLPPLLRIAMRLSLTLIVVASALFLSVGCGFFEETFRKPNRILIPEDFSGRVEIEYRVPSAPPLTIEDGYYLLEVEDDGTLKTSSGIDAGVPFLSSDQVVYRDSGEPITERATESRVGYWQLAQGWETDYRVPEPTTRLFISFFVGTLEQWKRLQEQDDRVLVQPIERSKSN